MRLVKDDVIKEDGSKNYNGVILWKDTESEKREVCVVKLKLKLKQEAK